MQSRRYIKTTEDRYFRALEAVVSDQWLLIGDREYGFAEVLAAEVISGRRKSDWHMFMREQLNHSGVMAPMWAIAFTLNWSLAWPLVGIWSGETLSRLWSEWKNPLEYTLILHINAEPILISTRKHKAGLTSIADEINKRIGYSQLSGPLLPMPPQPYQQSGEPTRRIMVK